jgi:hypothetical protein
MKKQPAWGYRVARLLREVNRRVTYALRNLEYAHAAEFPTVHKHMNFN